LPRDIEVIGKLSVESGHATTKRNIAFPFFYVSLTNATRRSMVTIYAAQSTAQMATLDLRQADVFLRFVEQ
jgi:hypothetical protein